MTLQTGNETSQMTPDSVHTVFFFFVFFFHISQVKVDWRGSRHHKGFKPQQIHQQRWFILTPIKPAKPENWKPAAPRVRRSILADGRTSNHGLPEIQWGLMADGFSSVLPGLKRPPAYMTPSVRAAQEHAICTRKVKQKQDNKSTFLWRCSSIAGSSVASDTLLETGRSVKTSFGQNIGMII